MPAVTPPAITPLPSPPDPLDRATFDAKAYPWTIAQGVFATQVGAVAANVYANAQVAESVATNVDAQIGIAAGHATAAGTSAGQALGYRNTAQSSAADAVASQNAAAASAVTASKLNLGAKATEPALDNQGAALLTGATYYDTTLTKWRVWSGAAWVEGLASVAGVTSVNGMTGDITISPTPEVKTPTTLVPANAATSVGERPTFSGSTFYALYGSTQASVQIQIHTSNVWTSPVFDSGEVAGATVTTEAGDILPNTAYYWRLRYKNSLGNWSEWSTATTFTTAVKFNDYVATPAATPAIGASFEGGYYTGMIWNELIQSSTSITIGTGTQVFTVPNMASSPVVYFGQTVEVRSRADPTKKMTGTVVNALATTLTLNITSVAGSGTLTDWSVMGTFRLIVSPKSSGESSKAYKNANTAAPSACGTLTEGLKATLAMVAAGSSTVYPAAHWCNNLNIGGKTDWYLPARDEVELAYRNLKPFTGTNTVTANRATGATPNYMNLGSYGDTANTHGLNNNSSPTGFAYTSGSPARTGVTAFRDTGTEYLALSLLNSTEYSTTDGWVTYLSSGSTAQQTYTKNTAFSVRAFRRSVI